MLEIGPFLYGHADARDVRRARFAGLQDAVEHGVPWEHRAAGREAGRETWLVWASLPGRRILVPHKQA
jgi:hypothetical protein